MGTATQHGFSERQQRTRRQSTVLSPADKSLRTCLNLTPIPIGHLNHDLRFTFVNAAMVELAGRASSEMIGKNIGDIFPALEGWRNLRTNAVQHGSDGQMAILTSGGGDCDHSFVLTFIPSPASVLENGSTDHSVIKNSQACDRRDEFLAVLEHELRNPLTPMLAWTEVLKQDPAITPNMRRAVEAIEKSVRQQRTLVEDLLDLAGLRNGRVVCEQVPLELNAVLTEVITRARDKAQEKGVILIFESQSQHVEVRGDRLRLLQMFENLVDNAIKFTPTGARVNARLTCTGTWVRVDVLDSGIGIPPEFMSQIFKPFTQAHPLSSRHRRGLGLGLALVKELTQQHGGRIEVTSDGESKGAQFSVFLPMCPVLKPNAPAPSTLLSGRSRKVLIVEDRDDTREALRMLLEAWGVQIAEAPDGESGLKLIGEFKPDLVLCDLSMPVMDGWTMAREIRTRYPHLKIPLIAMSGHGTPADVRHSLHCGFRAHLVKPCEASVLLTILTEYLPVKQ
ncbi:MAG TPA: ATP-binding protein [Planctomycetota bacterium]|nr:ATP-binding protein [Planctomycetota bacterium]